MRRTGECAALVSLALLVAACGGAAPLAADAARDLAPTPDAGPPDAGPPDAGPPDAAGSADLQADALGADGAGIADATIADVTIADGGPIDGGSDAAVDTGPAACTGFPASLVGVRPTVTVEKSAGQADKTTQAPIVFDVTFSEPIDVATFSASDIEVSGILPAAVQVFDSGDHQLFQVQLSGIADWLATYRVSLPGGRVADLHGDLNETSTSSDPTVTYQVEPATSVRIGPSVTPLFANTLPIDFGIQFSRPIKPASFGLGDILDSGSASGISWTLSESVAGLAYKLSATAVATPGTLKPAIPAGAIEDNLGGTNVASVFVGEAATYTTLPILTVADATADEGDSASFYVTINGTPVGDVTFDWSTSDGSAEAGTDYAAEAQTGVKWQPNALALKVSHQPGDDLPEQHKAYAVQLSNVSSNVFVARSTAEGTVRNDDQGPAIWWVNSGSYGAASPEQMLIDGDDAWIVGTSTKTQGTLRRVRLSTGSADGAYVHGNQTFGSCITADSTHYYYVVNKASGPSVYKRIHGTSQSEAAFGNGELMVSEAGHALTFAACSVDGNAIYLAGKRVNDATGDSAWIIEKRSSTDGSLIGAFGSGGRLIIEGVAGPATEESTRLRVVGGQLYVLGHVDGSWQLQQRDGGSGALVAGFASGGVLMMADYSIVADVVHHAGKLHLLGKHSCGTRLSRLEASTGAEEWAIGSTMDDPGALAIDATGIYLGGAKALAFHIERRELGGKLIWAQTALRDRTPAKATTIARIPGHYVYAAGYHESSQGRDWYYEGRSIDDGLRYTHAPGKPPE